MPLFHTHPKRASSTAVSPSRSVSLTPVISFEHYYLFPTPSRALSRALCFVFFLWSFAQADGDVQQLVGEVAALRKELETREKAGKACVAEAKRRLAETNGRGADMLEDLFKHEVIHWLVID